MGRRVVNGSRFTENGWPIVDQAGCRWVKVPGADVTIQVQDGPPAIIMPAWAADWNAYIEPLRDADSASWTEGNSVLGGYGKNNGSNHLGGTAEDLNWNSHPFRQRGSLNAAQMQTLAEMEAFYEGNMFWAGRWDDPADEMHSQMGYGTYDQENDRPEPKVFDFINRKIRADGFSTFRRGGTPTPPPTPTATGSVDVLRAAMQPTSVSDATLAAYLSAFGDAMRAAQINTARRAAAWCSQIGHESAGLKYMAEIETSNPSWNADRTRYRGRGPIQLTWSSNYRKFGQWCQQQGYVTDPEMFVNLPELVEQPKWGFLAASWYWLNGGPRPGQINGFADAGDILSVSRCVNGWVDTPNGMPDRTARYNTALVLGDQLLTLVTASGPTTPGDDFMSALSDDQQRQLFDMVSWLAAPGTGELRKKFPSRSQVRNPNEGLVDTIAGMELNTDGNVDLIATFLRYHLGYPGATDRLQRVAAGGESNRSADDALIAQAILAMPRLFTGQAQPAAPAAAAAPAAPVAPQVVYVPTPAPETAPAAPSTTGQVIGAAYDALEALQLSGVLSDTEKAPLLALIGVLQTKTEGAPA